MAKDHLKVVRKGGGVLRAWIEKCGNEDFIFVRESLDRGRDVQTVGITRPELLKIVTMLSIATLEEKEP
jgi:hypothetical protein